MQPIGILGGLFDPIHFGHLRVALEVLQGVPLGELRLLPCGAPPHRDPPVASGEQRLHMTRLAAAGEPGLSVDDREVRRAGPSYMVDTLASLREELGAAPLCLVVGMDAFLGLHTWHRWQEIPRLAHLIVAHRPGWQAPDGGPAAPPVTQLLHQARAARAADLAARPAGLIWMQPVTQLAISSTHIRALVASGSSPRYLLPDAVWDYINTEGLYRR